ncbi:AMP-binding protein [Streptomonospora litoralis]|uniref:Long-chain-fatty-acid--CoA ligase n=1 Tax=Streptomonospora litoralis TaxID=2498135 RepID=A0A4P6Q656_9ACTN|nr:class I adenylate-forming enzyme family protein [Streptomonospora litoralis]QBI56153.1 Long-chain-fatty-acid--CoA ligase [Streptomonospora litoralis]
MHDFAISTGDTPTTSARGLGRRLTGSTLPTTPQHRPIALSGTDQRALACATAWALAQGQPIILQPAGVGRRTPPASALSAAPTTIGAPAGETDWRVALYSSGSTGSERAYAFTAHHLDQLATWYADVYTATEASVIVTHLPIAYNFAFIAGLCLAANLGARLHLAASPQAAFADADRLASEHDRCIILGNPVLLAAPPHRRLAENVLIDSGGAPLSTATIRHYREHIADVREGYGLTETGSLTHFDREAHERSLGTVGTAMPHVETSIAERDGHPRIALHTPVVGIPLAGSTPPPHPGGLVTSDIGRIDASGRLRLLGRADDHPINGAWPRDVLDHIGPLLGTRSAYIHHPTPGHVRIRLHGRTDPARIAALRTRAADRLDLPPRSITVQSTGRLLHSHKIPRPTPATEDVSHG